METIATLWSGYGDYSVWDDVYKMNDTQEVLSFIFIQCRNPVRNFVDAIPTSCVTITWAAVSGLGFRWHGSLHRFAFPAHFPFQVTSTWQVWPKACTATCQSSWPPGMASRAAWHPWTWTGACRTSSTMPSIAVGRLNVAVKVPPLSF